jgi:hypothetical protein
MKKLYTSFLLLLLFTSTAISQPEAEKALMEKLGSEACKNINKAGIKEKDDAAEIEMKLGMALLPVFKDNAEEIRKVYGIDVNTPEGSGKIGEKLGAYAVYNCEKFRDITMMIMKKDEKLVERVKEKMDEKKNESETDSEFISGKIDRIEKNEIAIIYVSTNDGETIKLLWLENFDGSNLLESEKFQNKNFKIYFGKRSIYQPKANTYKEVKVISGISEL